MDDLLFRYLYSWLPLCRCCHFHNIQFRRGENPQWAKKEGALMNFLDVACAVGALAFAYAFWVNYIIL